MNELLNDPKVIGAIASVAVVIFRGPWLLNKLLPDRPAIGSREGRYITLLQTERKEADERTRQADRRTAILMNYASDLVAHINQGKPPPPPDWPEELFAPVPPPPTPDTPPPAT